MSHFWTHCISRQANQRRHLFSQLSHSNALDLVIVDLHQKVSSNTLIQVDYWNQHCIADLKLNCFVVVMIPLHDQPALYQRSESAESDCSVPSLQDVEKDSPDTSLHRRQIFHDYWTGFDNNSGTYEVFVQNARGIRFRTAVNVQEYVPDILSTDDDSDDDNETEKPPKWFSKTQESSEINEKHHHKHLNEVILNTIRVLQSCFITSRSISSNP